MKLKSILIIFIPLMIFVLSCGTDYNYTINKKRLLKNTWEINTYVDYNQNSTIEIRKAKYIFEESGTLIKIYENNDTVSSNWVLSGDGNYLTLGDNTFKVTELTNRVMSLRYGDVEMFFISL